MTSVNTDRTQRHTHFASVAELDKTDQDESPRVLRFFFVCVGVSNPDPFGYKIEGRIAREVQFI